MDSRECVLTEESTEESTSVGDGRTNRRQWTEARNRGEESGRNQRRWEAEGIRRKESRRKESTSVGGEETFGENTTVIK